MKVRARRYRRKHKKITLHPYEAVNFTDISKGFKLRPQVFMPFA